MKCQNCKATDVKVDIVTHGDAETDPRVDLILDCGCRYQAQRLRFCGGSIVVDGYAAVDGATDAPCVRSLTALTQTPHYASVLGDNCIYVRRITQEEADQPAAGWATGTMRCGDDTDLSTADQMAAVEASGTLGFWGEPAEDVYGKSEE